MAADCLARRERRLHDANADAGAHHRVFLTLSSNKYVILVHINVMPLVLGCPCRHGAVDPHHHADSFAAPSGASAWKMMKQIWRF
ncbi:MAG TPA: hypothetical protein VG308_08180 [Stellaceae bacterium]|nr:hypothetical protein [Stellaceae bacterium]